MVKKKVEETEDDIIEGEAEMAKEANKSVVEQMAEFQERKEKAKDSVDAFKADKSVPEGTKTRAPISRDTSKLDEFKAKLIADFSLNEKTDSHGCVQLKLKNTNVIKLLPRKGWYGVWREDPAQDNKVHSFRVASDEDELTHYDFVKAFVDAQTKEA